MRIVNQPVALTTYPPQFQWLGIVVVMPNDWIESRRPAFAILAFGGSHQVSTVESVLDLVGGVSSEVPVLRGHVSHATMKSAGFHYAALRSASRINRSRFDSGSCMKYDHATAIRVPIVAFRSVDS